VGTVVDKVGQAQRSAEKFGFLTINAALIRSYSINIAKYNANKT
jgi:hypothetical protein